MALCKYLEDNYEIFLERTTNSAFCQNTEADSKTTENKDSKK